MKGINSQTKIFLTGHNGMVGSACLKQLRLSGYNNVIIRNSKELDLTTEVDVFKFIAEQKPEIIINAAAKVGGILANNNYPYEFLIENMAIQNNLIRAAHDNNIQKFIFLGSSCIYPKFSKQPIKETYLLDGALEETNQWYAIAKISGVKLIEALRNQYNRDYIALMPTNLYGPNDNYNLENSHVIPALIRKFHDAKTNNYKSVELWGDGSPKREFLHVNDLAAAIIHVLESDMKDHIYNVGSGYETSIKDLANTIKDIVGFKGDILWDVGKPNGTPRKLLDSTKLIDENWKAKISLEDGLNETYKNYKVNFEKLRK